MTDLYANFAALADSAAEGTDYEIQAEDRASAILVMAPHGGGIERGTSEVAREIARDDLSLYLFEGVRRSGNGELHITSTNFDEPTAQHLLERAETVIAVHGRKDGGDIATIWLGGRATALRNAISESLRTSGFQTATAQELPGLESSNICNRGRSTAGVQLELPRSLRHRLIDDGALLKAFGDAIRQVL